jgi:MFS transporter, DHA2 family, multidrug resistance protein
VTRFGRKRVFIAAVVGFTVASVLCGLAENLDQMVLYRLVQGIFGAPLVPLAQAVLLDSYPRERHGSAMAIWGIGVMVGPILGPTLGGWLTDAYNWRWVFFINVPVGVVTMLGLMAYLTDSAHTRSRFDFVGFGLLAVAIGALQMMLDRGEQLDWFSSTEIVIEASLAALCSYMFVVHLLTAENPFIDPRMFADRNFANGLLAIFIVGIILLATLALLTPFIQNLLGYPVLTAGLVIAPRGLGTIAAMMIVGRVDPRAIFAFGLALIAFTLWEMANYTLDVSSALIVRTGIVRTGIVQGFGLGFVFIPLSTITFATLAPNYRTQGTALFSLMRNIGSSIGISVMTFLLTRNIASCMPTSPRTLRRSTSTTRSPGRLRSWPTPTTTAS